MSEKVDIEQTKSKIIAAWIAALSKAGVEKTPADFDIETRGYKPNDGYPIFFDFKSKYAGLADKILSDGFDKFEVSDPTDPFSNTFFNNTCLRALENNIPERGDINYHVQRDCFKIHLNLKKDLSQEELETMFSSSAQLFANVRQTYLSDPKYLEHDSVVLKLADKLSRTIYTSQRFKFDSIRLEDACQDQCFFVNMPPALAPTYINLLLTCLPKDAPRAEVEKLRQSLNDQRKKSCGLDECDLKFTVTFEQAKLLGTLDKEKMENITQQRVMDGRA